MKVKQCLDCPESFNSENHGVHESKLTCGIKQMSCSKVRKCPIFDDEDFDTLLNHWENVYDF